MNINKNILLSKTDIITSKYVCFYLRDNLQALHKKKKKNKTKQKNTCFPLTSFLFPSISL